MQYSHFDMNLLRTLDALLVEKSVTKAAERLCVSQPAMSGALQRLREHFKDQLLIRLGRNMALTPVGESLVNPVRATLLQIQSTLATRPTFDPKVAQRKFNIAMSDYGAFVLMPPLLRRLALEAPSMTCHVEPISGGEASGRMENGDLDFFVTVMGCEVIGRHSAAGDMKTRKLHADDFVCLVDQNNNKVGDVLTPAQYAQSQHAIVRFGQNQHTLVEQAWRRDNLKLKIAAMAPSFSTMLFMLPGTQMIATAPRRLAVALAPSLQLKTLECPLQIPHLQQILMWHPRIDSDPGHQYLRQRLVEAAGSRMQRRDSQFGQNVRPAPHRGAREFERVPAA